MEQLRWLPFPMVPVIASSPAGTLLDSWLSVFPPGRQGAADISCASKVRHCLAGLGSLKCSISQAGPTLTGPSILQSPWR